MKVMIAKAARALGQEVLKKAVTAVLEEVIQVVNPK